MPPAFLLLYGKKKRIARFWKLLLVNLMKNATSSLQSCSVGQKLGRALILSDGTLYGDEKNNSYSLRWNLLQFIFIAIWTKFWKIGLLFSKNRWIVPIKWNFQDYQPTPFPSLSYKSRERKLQIWKLESPTLLVASSRPLRSPSYQYHQERIGVESLKWIVKDN